MPTPKQIFAEHPGVECASAGLNEGADNPLASELLAWPEWIFGMKHDLKAKRRCAFRPYLNRACIVCLNISDNDGFMNLTRVKLLQTKVSGFLPKTH